MAYGDLGEFARFEVFGEATRVDNLEVAIASGPALFIIDEAAAATFQDGDLRPIVSSGSALIGLEMSRYDLDRLTGFGQELQELNPNFADYLGPRSVSDEPPGTYSLLWRTPPGTEVARWKTLQHNLSDGMFDMVIERQKLLVRGLTRDGDEIIPLEDYGQTSD